MIVHRLQQLPTVVAESIQLSLSSLAYTLMEPLRNSGLKDTEAECHPGI